MLAHAEVPFLARKYNEFSNGRVCRVGGNTLLKTDAMKTDMVEKLNCESDEKKRADELQKLSIEMFDWSVFNLASERQIQKNKCISERIDALMKDEALLSAWNAQLIAAWLGMKKADLMLKKCRFKLYDKDSENQSENQKIARKSRGQPITKLLNKTKVEISRSDQKLDQELKDVCTNDKAVAALEGVRKLFQLSLPVFSDQAFFNILEKNRKAIINKTTGKPLTDNELLHMDLQNLTTIGFDPAGHKETAKFPFELKSRLSSFSTERIKMAEELARIRQDPNAELDSEMKTYIYDDDTVYETLMTNKLLKASYVGLSTEKKEDISNAAFCLLAKYESTFVGETLDYVIKLAAFGGTAGLIVKSVKGVRYLSKLSTVQNSKKTVSGALLMGDLALMAPIVAQSCPLPTVGSESYRMKKVVHGNKHQAVEKTDVAHLVAEVNYTVWDDNIDPHLTPSCLKIENSEKINTEVKNEENPTHEEIGQIFSESPVDKLSNNAVLNASKDANTECLLNILIGLVSAHAIVKFVQ